MQQFNWLGVIGALAVLVGAIVGCSQNTGSDDNGLASQFQSRQDQNVAVRIYENRFRVPKSAFNGTYLFLKSVTRVETASEALSAIPAGIHLSEEQLVKFVFSEKTLDIVAIDPIFKPKSNAQINPVLASFGTRHVDISVTAPESFFPGREVEDDTLRGWKDRTYAVIDPSNDSMDIFVEDTGSARAQDSFEVSANDKSIQIDVVRHLKDGTEIEVRYSLLPWDDQAKVETREYTSLIQSKFGFFDAETYVDDGSGVHNRDNRKLLINRWDLSKPIVYTISPDCPEEYQDSIDRIVAGWNAAFKEAVGKEMIQTVRKRVSPGDLRYSGIHCDIQKRPGSSLLGYGPMVTNPRTGQIVKGDVFLYLDTLRRATANDVQISKVLGLTPLKPEVIAEKSLDKETARVLARLAGQVPQLNLATESEPNEAYAKLLNQDPKALLQALRKPLASHERNELVVVNSAFLAAADEKARTQKLTTEELQRMAFEGTLVHEMGHTLGLRHNFQASADHEHMEKGAAATSVMDYTFFNFDGPFVPGPYDRAAIAVSYGDAGKIPNQLAKNFAFCTDDDLADVRAGLCSQFDSGDTLEKAAKHHYASYQAAYPFLNVRSTRLKFDGDVETYLQRVAHYLLPLRVVHDNAAMIIATASQKSVEGLGLLWQYTGQRIEADASSKKENIVVIKIQDRFSPEIVDGGFQVQTSKIEKSIDVSKIPAIVKDAQAAMGICLQSLVTILIDGTRPSDNVKSSATGELELMGTMPDRILSAMLLVQPLSGAPVTPYLLNQEVIAPILAGVASNTLPTRGPKREVRYVNGDFPMELRELAIKLLASQVNVPIVGATTERLLGVDRIALDSAIVEKALATNRELQLLKGSIGQNGGGAKSDMQVKIDNLQRELDALFAANPVDLRTIVDESTARLLIQTTWASLYLGGQQDAAATKAALEQIQTLEDLRNAKFNLAYTQFKPTQYFRTSVRLDEQSLLENVAGIIIRNRINRIEDELAGETLAVEQLQKQGLPQPQLDLVKKQLADADMTSLEQLRSEKRFVAKIAKLLEQ